MSFFTALADAYGGYGAGRQQRFTDTLAQQQQATQQRYADVASREAQVKEATYREAAKQMLQNQNIDPATATWNPQSLQFEGGKPYAMPKGWEVVPSDPQQAANHWSRLMSMYLQQGRGSSDAMSLASQMYGGAQQQIAADTRYQQQLGLEYLRQQNSQWLEYARERFHGNEDQLNRDQAMQIHQDEVTVRQSLHNSFTPGELYNASIKSPEAALKTFDSQLGRYREDAKTVIGNLSKSNQSAASKYRDQPQPDMTGYSQKLMAAISLAEQNPGHVNNIIASIKKHQADYNNDDGAKDGMSDDQAAAAIQIISNVANAARGRAAAQNTVDRIGKSVRQGTFMQQYGGGGDYGGGDDGGSDDGSNPTKGGAKLAPRQIWDMVRRAGASPREATILSAIAMAESGGDPGAVNPTDNNGQQTSWGLFQISDGTHRVLPGWNDPQKNVQMAIAKLRSRRGFRHWGTYTTGAYRRYLPGGG
jgi:hypothetical protein